MTGLGTMVNCAAIIAGCAVGLILKKGFPEKWQETIMYGVALCIFLIGVEMAQKSQNIVLVIASVVIGSIIGEMLDIQEKLNAFGAWVEKKLLGDRGQTSGSFGRGFISASLIFCIGAMAIVGSIEDGLTGNRQILFAKAMLDGILSFNYIYSEYGSGRGSFRRTGGSVSGNDHPACFLDAEPADAGNHTGGQRCRRCIDYGYRHRAGPASADPSG